MRGWCVPPPPDLPTLPFSTLPSPSPPPTVPVCTALFSNLQQEFSPSLCLMYRHYIRVTSVFFSADLTTLNCCPEGISRIIKDSSDYLDGEKRTMKKILNRFPRLGLYFPLQVDGNDISPCLFCTTEDKY